VDTVRVLAADAVQKVGNGHPGTAMSLAPLAYTLFQRVMRHDPNDGDWIGRDRFVLSCGHSSLTLYIQLFLSGYGLVNRRSGEGAEAGEADPGGGLTIDWLPIPASVVRSRGAGRLWAIGGHPIACSTMCMRSGCTGQRWWSCAWCNTLRTGAACTSTRQCCSAWTSSSAT
jgi:hypothetical protein